MSKPIAWRFYVYEVLDALGRVIYVGKGSERRIDASRRERGGVSAQEVARFKKESDAYAFEIAHIAERSPELNKHPGGNGSKAARQCTKKTQFERAYEALGPRAMAAQLWLAYYDVCKQAGAKFPGDCSKVEQFRAVAYG